jgi:hypothetical protein
METQRTKGLWMRAPPSAWPSSKYPSHSHRGNGRIGQGVRGTAWRGEQLRRWKEEDRIREFRAFGTGLDYDISDGYS